MKLRLSTTRFALVLLAGAVLAVSMSAAEKKGNLRAEKECSQYHGLPWEFCTFTSSDFGPITSGTKVYYTQAANLQVGFLDTNVVLDSGQGNRALGRCTVDMTTATGLCTFSDGTGQFAGFQARINVTYLGGRSWRWDGTYSFDHDSNRN